jgi:hypothetical protein
MAAELPPGLQPKQTDPDWPFCVIASAENGCSTAHHQRGIKNCQLITNERKIVWIIPALFE